MRRSALPKRSLRRPLLVVLLGLLATPLMAELALQEKLDSERRRLGEVRDRFKTVQRKIRVLTSRRKVLETQLAMNRNERSQLERQIDKLKSEAKLAARNVARATLELEQAEAAYQGYLGEFESRLNYIYKRSTLSPMGAMVHSRSLGEFVTRARYYRFLREDAGQLSTLQESRDLIARRKRELEQAREGADRLRRELTSRERSLSQNIDEQSRLLEQIRRERDHEVSKAAKLQEASHILETKIANLNKAATVVRDRQASRPPAPTRKPLGPGDLRWPLDGDITIARAFGRATNEAGTTEFNSGIDLLVAAPSQVKATAAGRVMFQGVFSAVYGKVVMIDHGGSPVNIISLYGNLDTILVGLNQEVRAGDTLGTVGGDLMKRGATTHLHFEVRKGTEAQDPRRWLSHR